MLRIFLLMSMLSLAGVGISQPCPPGNITFSSQEEIDAFPQNYPGCTVVPGNLIIKGLDLTNGLDSLYPIVEIAGDLVIRDNKGLSDLKGLDGLSYVGGDILIRSNTDLRSLTGLEKLNAVQGNLELILHDSLADLQGLKSLQWVGGDLKLYNNDALINLEGLNNIDSIHGSFLLGNVELESPGGIRGNKNLENLKGLEQLKYVGDYLRVYRNESLRDLTGLNGLNRVDKTVMISWCPLLESLSGLESLKIVGDRLRVGACSSLLQISEDLRGLEYVGGTIELFALPIVEFDFIVQLDTIFGLDLSDLPALHDLSILLNFTEINGNLYISSMPINLLLGLRNIQRIDGRLDLRDLPQLETLSGLDNIHTVGYITLWDLKKLQHLKNLKSLERVLNSFDIVGLPSLENLDGLEQLEFVGSLKIFSADLARNILVNERLENIDGLRNLKEVRFMSISRLPSLNSLDGIDSVILNKETTVYIIGNELLDVCHVKSICNYLRTNPANANIEDNATGCNSAEEVLEQCDKLLSVNGMDQPAFSVFPNPSSGEIRWEGVEAHRVRVLGLDGRVYTDRAVSESRLDLGGTPTGMYLIEFHGTWGKAVQKILVE